MADYWPASNGLWSTLSNWLTATGQTAGVLPSSGDDVFADNKTITVDVNANVLSLRTTARTGGTAGGVFNPNNNISLSAINFIPGSNSVVDFLLDSPNTCTLVGNISGSSSNNIASIRNSSTGSMTIIGNIEAGINGNGFGVNNLSTGTVTIYGNVSGARITTVTGIGVNNNAGGIINIFGNINGRIGYGCRNVSSGIINVAGNIVAGTTTDVYGLLNNSNGFVSISGNVFGGTGTNSFGVFNSTGTVSITGNVTGGSGQSSHGAFNPELGYITIVGTVSGGSGNFSAGVSSGQGGSLGTVVIVGDVYGGSGSGGAGLVQIGRLCYSYIFGNVYGGTGTNATGAGNNINTTHPGYIYIQGNVYGGLGSGAFGVQNAPGGFVYVYGIVVGNGFGLNSTSVGISQSVPGIDGRANGTTIIAGLSCGSRGQWPTLGNIFILPQSNSTATFKTSAFQDVTLFTSFSANIVPPISSVRLGTKYNLNDYIGTCTMPSVSSVLHDVAVDNFMGIAALQPQTVWNVQTSAVDINLLGGRLKESTTIQSFGQLLTAFNM